MAPEIGGIACPLLWPDEEGVEASPSGDESTRGAVGSLSLMSSVNEEDDSDLHAMAL
jgi:hypothetical protein